MKKILISWAPRQMPKTGSFRAAARVSRSSSIASRARSGPEMRLGLMNLRRAKIERGEQKREESFGLAGQPADMGGDVQCGFEVAPRVDVGAAAEDQPIQPRLAPLSPGCDADRAAPGKRHGKPGEQPGGHSATVRPGDADDRAVVAQVIQFFTSRIHAP